MQCSDCMHQDDLLAVTDSIVLAGLAGAGGWGGGVPKVPGLPKQSGAGKNGHTPALQAFILPRLHC